MYVSITNIRNKSEIQKQNRIELKISQKKGEPGSPPPTIKFTRWISYGSPIHLANIVINFDFLFSRRNSELRFLLPSFR